MYHEQYLNFEFVLRVPSTSLFPFQILYFSKSTCNCTFVQLQVLGFSSNPGQQPQWLLDPLQFRNSGSYSFALTAILFCSVVSHVAIISTFSSLLFLSSQDIL